MVIDDAQAFAAADHLRRPLNSGVEAAVETLILAQSDQ